MSAGPHVVPAAHDARRHLPDGADPPDPWWHERWAFDCWSPEGTGVSTCLVLLPGQQRAWYWSALVRPDAPLLAVWDLDAPLPRQGLTLRSHGLWAEHVCEAPGAQWTVANECHAVALDDPAEALGRGLGHQAAMAVDAEWYAAGPPDGAGPAGVPGWAIPGEVHGVVELGGGGRVLLDGLPARYRRSWGPLPFVPAEPDGAVDPPAGRGAPVPLPGPNGPLALLRVLTPAGWWEQVRALP